MADTRKMTSKSITRRINDFTNNYTLQPNKKFRFPNRIRNNPKSRERTNPQERRESKYKFSGYGSNFQEQYRTKKTSQMYYSPINARIRSSNYRTHEITQKRPSRSKRD